MEEPLTMPWTTPVTVLLLVAALRGATGASLAEAAFFEGLRRAATPKAERSLNLTDHPELRHVASPSAPTNPEPRTKNPEQEPREPAEPLEPSEPSEKVWRERASAAREALDRDQFLAEATQGRVNSLTNEAFGRDDPAQREELMRQRQRAIDELDRLTKQVAKDKEAIAAIEEDARKKGIPPGWIRL